MFSGKDEAEKSFDYPDVIPMDHEMIDSFPIKA